MEILGLFLALVALFWASRNHTKTERLEAKQLKLQRDFARLQAEVERKTLVHEPAAAPVREPKPEPPPVPQPKPEVPAPKREPEDPKPAPPPRVAQEPRDIPPPAPPRPIPPPPVRAQKPAFDWEALVGVKLFSWLAGIALVFAAIFFLKYSVEHGWLSPPIRMAIGLLTGTALLVVCEWKAARRYAVTTNALDAAGIAILFATFFAGHEMWHLVPALPTFGLMALVTAVAVLLSVRHNSIFVAVLGLLGGFATPALLSTGEDRPISLFSYLVLLNAGLAWVAYRKRWPALSVLSAIFTALYQWLWVKEFLQAGTIPLSLGIFLVFPVLSFGALFLGEGGAATDEKSSIFRRTAAAVGLMPLLFTMYMAVVPAYGGRYWLMFGFLFLINVGLTAIAWKRGPELLHLAGGLATLVTVCIYLGVSYTNAVGVTLIVTSVFVAFYLATGYWLPFKDHGKAGVFAAPLLLVAFPALAAIEPGVASPSVLFSVLFVLVGAIAAYAIARREGAIHVLGAVFVFAAEGVWSVKYLDASRLGSALLIYLIFGLFYLAIPLVTQRLLSAAQTPRMLERSLYLALGSHLFLFFVSLQALLTVPPWPFLGVLLILNVGIGVAALYMRRAEPHLIALAASQIILIAWQASVQTLPWPSVAIASTLLIAAMGFMWFLLGRKLEFSRTDLPQAVLGAASVVASVLGMVGLIVWQALAGSSEITLLATAIAIFIGLLLAIDHLTEWRAIAPFIVVLAACVVGIWSVLHFAPARWGDEMLLSGLVYGMFMAYPVLQGSRIKTSIGPHLAAVTASVAFFFFARHALVAAGFSAGIGLLPVGEAALLTLLLWRLLKQDAGAIQVTGRMALVAGAILAFITVAIPLQLEKQWVTIGWALQAAALAWLIRKIPHKGLYWWTFGLLVAVFARLALNPAVLTYYPSSTPIFNWYLYTYLVCAAAMLFAAWRLHRVDQLLGDVPAISSLAAGAGVVLLFLLVNIEIRDYYSTETAEALAKNLTYTISWGLFAFALLSAGIWLASKGARGAAIGLLSVTVAKCFLYDLWSLGGLYRIGSFVGLAVCLTLVALLLQRFVLRPQGEMK